VKAGRRRIAGGRILKPAGEGNSAGLPWNASFPVGREE
jgi:hypothetical protein